MQPWQGEGKTPARGPVKKGDEPGLGYHVLFGNQQHPPGGGGGGVGGGGGGGWGFFLGGGGVGLLWWPKKSDLGETVWGRKPSGETGG